MAMESETLLKFYEASAGGTDSAAPNAGGQKRTLFLNAQYSPAMDAYASSILCQQFFYPFAKILQDKGFESHPSPDGGSGFEGNIPEIFSHVLLLGTKNVQETNVLMHQAYASLVPGGWFLCAAGNKEGGTRLAKQAAQAGFEGITSASKNKMRIVTARRPAALSGAGTSADQNTTIAAPLASAVAKPYRPFEPRKTDHHSFYTAPGLFGWDKIDVGSEALMAFIPDDLSGSGADFGCGYGYLTHKTLEKCQNIEKMSLYDADFRALEAAKRNLSPKISYIWDDLTDCKAKRGPFDFIVMNPPFHQNKQANTQIGQDFIQSAAHALRPRGSLYMVANAHLPYEEPLRRLFSSVKTMGQQNGFKIFHGVR